MRHSHGASSVTWPILNLYKLSRSKLLYDISKSKTFPFIFCSIYFYLPYQFLRLTEWGTRLPMVNFPFGSHRSGSLPSHSWPPPSGRKRETESRLFFFFFLIKFSLVPWYKTSGLGCKLPLKRNYKSLHFSENQTKQGKTHGRKLNHQLVERVGEGKKKT